MDLVFVLFYVLVFNFRNFKLILVVFNVVWMWVLYVGVCLVKVVIIFMVCVMKIFVFYRKLFVLIIVLVLDWLGFFIKFFSV